MSNLQSGTNVDSAPVEADRRGRSPLPENPESITYRDPVVMEPEHSRRISNPAAQSVNRSHTLAGDDLRPRVSHPMMPPALPDERIPVSNVVMPRVPVTPIQVGAGPLNRGTGATREALRVAHTVLQLDEGNPPIGEVGQKQEPREVRDGRLGSLLHRPLVIPIVTQLLPDVEDPGHGLRERRPLMSVETSLYAQWMMGNIMTSTMEQKCCVSIFPL